MGTAVSRINKQKGISEMPSTFFTSLRIKQNKPQYCVGDDGIWMFRQGEGVEWTFKSAIISAVALHRASKYKTFFYNLSNENGDIIATDILEVNLEKVSPKFSDLEFDWYQWKFKSKADTEWTTIEARISQGTWSSEHYSFVYSLHNKTGEIIAADILEENLEIA